MQFTLHYRGKLQSNGKRAHKHEIRRAFHRQLKQLWGQVPLSECHAFFEPEVRPERINIRIERSPFSFVPLVSTKLGNVCELDCSVLWPQTPGSILSAGGDIDNRLKTLFDALKVPSGSDDLPPSEAPNESENPFFCLVEDDRLITRVNVETDQLLEPGLHDSEVELTIRVVTRKVRLFYGTLLLP